MSAVDAQAIALAGFLQHTDPDELVALLITAGELTTLHLALEVLEEAGAAAGKTFEPDGPFLTLREKVLAVLQQGGYGNLEVDGESAEEPGGGTRGKLPGEPPTG